MATHVPNPAAPLKRNEWLTKWWMMNQWSSFGPLRLCCLFSAVIACHPKSLQIELNLFSLIWSKFQFAVFTYIIQVSRNISPDFIKVFYYFLFFILFVIFCWFQREERERKECSHHSLNGKFPIFLFLECKKWNLFLLFTDCGIKPQSTAWI